jgi:hypothetical protein
MKTTKTKSAHGAVAAVKECMTAQPVKSAKDLALSLLKKMRMIAMTLTNWPFPPATGAVPWTAKQIKAYQQAQRAQLPESPM